MDERFALVRQAPASALKVISAGRLRGKSDINPQWKIEAMTEVYGLCGEGWYHECAKEDIIKLDDGQIMVFMEIHVYTKDKEGNWSKPVVGFGGDFIVKKENNGLHFNDEAKKMCYTDALGNALKNLGVANDVYRSFWNGTKYSREENSALVQPTQQQDNQLLYDRVDGQIVINVNGRMYPLNRFNLEQLNRLQNDTRYSDIGNEIRDRMAELAQ